MFEVEWGINEGFYVKINPGLYIDHAGNAQAWSGGEINLASLYSKLALKRKQLVFIGITPTSTLTVYVDRIILVDREGPASGTYFTNEYIADRYQEATPDSVFWVAAIPLVYGDTNLSDAPNRATPVWQLSMGQNDHVRVSATDAIAASLDEKIAAGTGIVLDILNAGDDEDLEISVEDSIVDHVTDTNNPHNVTAAQAGAVEDGKLKVSSDDTTENYLESKVAAGTNITLATLNPGANEQLEITAEDKLVTITGADTTPGNFNAKVNSGNGITFGLLNPGANEIAVISVNESEISHLNIADIGTNSHAQIDTHIASTSNPHSVTAAQVGAVADGRLKVSSDDTTEDYLENKLVAGTGITLAVLNPAGNEDVQINVADNYVFNTGDTMTGGLFIDGSANEIQLRVQGNVAQDVNILEIENSSGTNLITVGASGILSTIRQISIDGSANEVQLRVEANATQTTFVVLIEDSTGTDKLVVDQNFRLGINTNVPGDILAVNAGAIRFTTTAGGDSQYSDIEQIATNLLKINQRNPSDSSWIDLNPIPSATGNSTIRMFNDVSSSGNPILYIYDGAGNIQHQIGNTIVWLNRQNFSACNFRVESSSANFMLYVASATNNVGINTGSPQTSSLLEIAGVGALLLPRLTTTQRNTLTAVDGMIIYNSTNGVIEGREGGAWVNL